MAAPIVEAFLLDAWRNPYEVKESVHRCMETL
jgi:hypothetical protein